MSTSVPYSGDIPMGQAIPEDNLMNVSRRYADLFADWLIALGGWAPVSGVERPIIHRLIRTHNPENKWGIPRRDLVISEGPSHDTAQFSREFEALFKAWDQFSKLSKRQG